MMSQGERGIGIILKLPDFFQVGEDVHSARVFVVIVEDKNKHDPWNSLQRACEL